MITLKYTGKREIVTLPSGMYLFKLWGASGADAVSYDTGGGTGGKGGYVEGTITFFTRKRLFAYVGGKGVTQDICYPKGEVRKFYEGGFNGGGKSFSSGAGGTGGGASDIRLNDNFESRIIVAGGGGGAGFASSGGYGGYPSGGNGTNTAKTGHVRSNGIGGTQDSGGSQRDCSSMCIEEEGTTYTNNGFSNSNGVFGEGGRGLGRYCGGGSGGGGWYGGGGTVNTGGAGGGSSYIDERFFGFKYENGVRTGDGEITITLIKNIAQCSCRRNRSSHLMIFMLVLASE